MVLRYCMFVPKFCNFYKIGFNMLVIFPPKKKKHVGNFFRFFFFLIKGFTLDHVITSSFLAKYNNFFTVDE